MLGLSPKTKSELAIEQLYAFIPARSPFDPLLYSALSHPDPLLLHCTLPCTAPFLAALGRSYESRVLNQELGACLRAIHPEMVPKPRTASTAPSAGKPSVQQQQVRGQHKQAGQPPRVSGSPARMQLPQPPLRPLPKQAGSKAEAAKRRGG